VTGLEVIVIKLAIVVEMRNSWFQLCRVECALSACSWWL